MWFSPLRASKRDINMRSQCDRVTLGKCLIPKRIKSEEDNPVTTFDDRERAFETKFAYDAEQAFKEEARRKKALALWAAELLGHRGEAAEDYAQTLVSQDLKPEAETKLMECLTQDLASMVSRADISAKMAELMRQSQNSQSAH